MKMTMEMKIKIKMQMNMAMKMNTKMEVEMEVEMEMGMEVYMKVDVEMEMKMVTMQCLFFVCCLLFFVFCVLRTGASRARAPVRRHTRPRGLTRPRPRGASWYAGRPALPAGRPALLQLAPRAHLFPPFPFISLFAAW